MLLRRFGLCKSLVTLAIMIAVSAGTALALPLPQATPGTEAVVRWTSETRTRFDQRFDAFAAVVPHESLRALYDPVPPDQVERRLAEVTRMKNEVAGYLRTLDGAEAEARRTLAALDIDDAARADRAAWLEANLSPTSPARRIPASVLRQIETQEQLLVLLRDNQGRWRLRTDGGTETNDRSMLAQLQALHQRSFLEDQEFRLALAAAEAQRTERRQ